jgi:replicative DNA helicase
MSTTAPNLNIDPGAPFSQEAEEAVIGSILIDPAAYISVAAFLKPLDFFMLRHQYIWQGFERLNSRNEPIDHITLAEELENMQVLETIGGRAYLIQLANNTGTSMYAEVYGRLVERTSIRRKLMVTADEIKKLAMDEKLNIDTVVSEAESKLFTVTEAQVKRDFVPMWDALSDYYDRMEYMLQHRTEAVGLPTGYRDLDTLLGGFQKSDLLIIAARPGMGKCCKYDTTIQTGLGTSTIEALKPKNVIGERDDEGGVYYPLEIDVLTPEGMRKTSHFYDAGEKPTLKITTRAGYQISATHNHPLLVLNKQAEKVWVRLGDLQAGEFVAVQRCDSLFGNITELPISGYLTQNWRNAHRPNIPAELSPDFAYYLGLLTGDGCLTNVNYIKFSSSDEELIQVFYEWGEKLGLQPRHNKNYDYNMGSTVFYQWLQQIDVKGYSHEKIIPQVILNAPQDCVRAFLQGLFDTDGHSEVQRGYIQFVTTSEKLARQVHIMLLQFGIVSKLSRKENAYRGAWLIRITGDNARKFYDNVGFRLSRKQERRNLLPKVSNGNLDIVPYLPQRVSVIPHSEKTNLYRYFNGKRAPSYEVLGRMAAHAPEVEYLLEPEYYWDEIVSIEDDGLQHCYDLVVPEVHSYIANGIVSHNTSWLLTTAMNTARFGARVAIFTMEMGVEQLIQRMVAMETGINVQKLRLAKLSPQEASRFTEAIGRISNYHIFIDDSPAISPMEMRTKARRLKHEYGLDLIIVDYMQLMNAGGSFENNRVQEISLISRSLKEMAREMNVPLISAAQLSRAVEQRQDKRPVLSDLRESGCLTGESLVYLPDCGYSVPIAELMGQKGFNVMSLNTETWKAEIATVTNAFCTGVKPVYKLTTALGRSIRATGNHKFLTIEGWKRLDELSIHEGLATPSTDEAKELIESFVYWDAVVSIEPDGEEAVYDLTVEPNHNFIANNVIIHNSIEQDSDIVMFLYRDEIYNEATEFPNQADVIVAKHRNGPTGTVSLYFEKSLTKFMDASVHRVDLSGLE